MMSCLIPAAPRVTGAASLSALLAACGSISGLDGRTDYACQAPPGVQCNSVSGNYANAIRNNLPSQRQSSATTDRLASAPTSHATSRPAPTGAAQTGKEAGTSAAESMAPLRSPPQILRLWVKAWEDADHDLVDQGYVYLQVDPGRWRLDHVQQRVRDAYVTIRPPHPSAATAPASSSAMAGPAFSTTVPARGAATPPLPASSGSGPDNRPPPGE